MMILVAFLVFMYIFMYLHRLYIVLVCKDLTYLPYSLAHLLASRKYLYDNRNEIESRFVMLKQKVPRFGNNYEE